jgi:cullin-4
MSKGMGEIARPDVVYLSKNIQPQIGIRKLVIKNLRREPRENLKDHYDRIWKQVSDALVAVFAGQEPKQPLERLYRDVEDICRNGQAEALFQHLNSSCNQYLETSLLPHISSQVHTGSSMVETLRIVHKGWEMWSTRSVGTLVSF